MGRLVGMIQCRGVQHQTQASSTWLWVILGYLGCMSLGGRVDVNPYGAGAMA